MNQTSKKQRTTPSKDSKNQNQPSDGDHLRPFSPSSSSVCQAKPFMLVDQSLVTYLLDLDICVKTKAVDILATTIHVDLANKSLQQLVFPGTTSEPVIHNFLWNNVLAFFARPVQKCIGPGMGHRIDCFWNGTMRWRWWVSCHNIPAMVCVQDL